MPGILLLNVARFTQKEIEQGDHADFTHVDRIGGGTIGGGPQSLANWHAAYYAMVKEYNATGRFLGKDQSVMASTCLKSNLCLLVQSVKHFDHWFQLQDWLHGDITTNYTRVKKNYH